MPRTEDPRHFLDLAFGYYMTGRFAALNSLRIAANLMHHAIELLIKYTLLKNVPEQQRSDETTRLANKYRHRLNALWDQYKQKVAPADLVRFDPAIRELHRWSDLRYAGYPDSDDVGMVFGWGRVAGALRTSGPGTYYFFDLHEVDDLFSAMIRASHINPPFIGGRYQTKALPEWYLRENQHALVNLFEP